MTIALLAQREPAFATKTVIEPEDFGYAAETFVAAQSTVESDLHDLGGSISGAGSTIGTDQTADYFWMLYQPDAVTVLSGLKLVHELVGWIAKGLAESATDHARADAVSAGKTDGGYDTYTVTPQAAPTLPTMADMRGKQGIPDGNDYGALLEARLKIAKDDAKLQSLASTWKTASDSFQQMTQDLTQSIDSLVSNNSGEDVTALEKFWEQYVGGGSTWNDSLFNMVQNAEKNIASAIDAYGQLLDSYKQKFADAAYQWASANNIPIFTEVIDVLEELLDNLTGDQQQSLNQALNGVYQQLLWDVQNCGALQALSYDRTDLEHAIASLGGPNQVTTFAHQAGDAGMSNILGPGVKTVPKKPLAVSMSQVQKKFKHAKAFGVNDDNNAAGRERWAQALKDHVDNPDTLHIDGVYNRGQTKTPAILNYNPSTGLVVVQDKATGSFITGFKPTSQQTWYILNKGTLGGG